VRDGDEDEGWICVAHPDTLFRHDDCEDRQATSRSTRDGQAQNWQGHAQHIQTFARRSRDTN
jgi:hypothetical protein